MILVGWSLQCDILITDAFSVSRRRAIYQQHQYLGAEQQSSAIRSCSFAVLVLPRPLLSGSKQARGRLRRARAAGWPSYFWVNAAICKGGLVTAQKARPLKKCCPSGTETTGSYAQLPLFPESTLPPNIFAFASCKTVALNFS